MRCPGGRARPACRPAGLPRRPVGHAGPVRPAPGRPCARARRGGAVGVATGTAVPRLRAAASGESPGRGSACPGRTRSSASGSMPYSSAACRPAAQGAAGARCGRSRCRARCSRPCRARRTRRARWARTALSASVPLALAASASARRSAAWASDDSAADTATARPGGDRAGDRRLRGPLPAPERGPLPGGPLGRGRGGERVGAAADGAQPLLDGAHLKARLHLGVARGRGPLRQFLALVVGLLVLELGVAWRVPRSSASASASSLFSAASLACVLLGDCARGAYRGVEPLGLVGRGPRGARQPAEPAGDLRRGRVHRLHPAAGLLELLPGRLLRLGRLGECLRRRLLGELGGGELARPPRRRRRARPAATARRADPPRAQCAPIRSPSAVTARKPGLSRTKPAASGEVRRHHDVAEQFPTAPASSSAPVTRSAAHRAPPGKDGPRWTSPLGRPGPAMTRPTVPAFGGVDGGQHIHRRSRPSTVSASAAAPRAAAMAFW